MTASGRQGNRAAASGTPGGPGVGTPQGRRIGFARWRSDLPSGGNRYDEELMAGLRALGLEVHEYPVTGPWPLPEPHERQGFAELLRAERDWLLGNIVGSAAPEEITAAVAAGRRVTLLMHYFPADDPSLSPSERRRLAATEARAVTAASGVVVTSEWAADQVAARYGRDDAAVAVPGFAPAPPAPGTAGGEAPSLLWLARLTRAKDPLTFVEALTRLTDLEWTARLVGPAVDAELTGRVRDRIERTGLADRVAVLGARDGEALEAEWARTDLLVHTSHTETYGMVVSEALARGIPSVVGSGTGAVEAQEVGATFPPGDVDALARTLCDWLTNPRLRERWRSDAAVARAQLPTWTSTARNVAAALGG